MPTARIIDGRLLAEGMLLGVAEELRALGVPVGLAAVCPGGNAELAAFVRLKQRIAESVGIEFSSYLVDDEAQARQTLGFLAADETVNGIFVELPLPTAWNSSEILKLIPEYKDVDALAPRAAHIVPAPAVVALRTVLEAEGIDVNRLHAAVIGQGSLIGTPVTRWLREHGAEVESIDIDTPEPASHTALADVLICGAGKSGLVTAEWIKEGATVIDFGYSRDAGGRMSGDVDTASAKKKAGALSPVPGGMGPLVVAAVMENLVTLATR
jgi:methylenetetrahydrofolate dehydrogenase (NADP+)/methenyltetrahydrofolate cyclohydrolase